MKNELLKKKKTKNYDELFSTSKINEFTKHIGCPAFLYDQNGNLLCSNTLAEDLPWGIERYFKHSLTQSLIHKNKDKGTDYFTIFQKNYYRTSTLIRFTNADLFLETLFPIEDLSSPKMLDEYVQTILDAVNDGIYITDYQGFTLYINKSYTDLVGISKEEVINKHVSELMDKGYFDTSITLKVMKHKQRVSILQRIKSSNKLWLVTGNPIFDERKKMKMIVNIVYDMTELNNLREELKKQSIALENQKREIQILRSQASEVPGLITISPKMSDVISRIHRMSAVDTSVLILGETGCGKNLVARSIHELSNRKNKNFIEVNCGAIPEHLFESELFGYKGGAFTGAEKSGKKGLIEEANGGTLFLDEIGDMPINLQVKLLSVLQNRKVRRLGDTREIDVDIRVIAATNKDPQKLIKENKLREDLYYRLAVVPIYIPPLRERVDDIYVLTNYFLNKFKHKHKREVKLSKSVYIALENYHWPGNVRELEHTIEQLVVLSEGPIIEIKDLPLHLQEIALQQNLQSYDSPGTSLKDLVQAYEKQVILKTWKEVNDFNQVAERLGLHRTTLLRKCKKLGLELKDLE